MNTSQSSGPASPEHQTIREDFPARLDKLRQLIEDKVHLLQSPITEEYQGLVCEDTGGLWRFAVLSEKLTFHLQQLQRQTVQELHNICRQLFHLEARQQLLSSELFNLQVTKKRAELEPRTQSGLQTPTFQLCAGRELQASITERLLQSERLVFQKEALSALRNLLTQDLQRYQEETQSLTCFTQKVLKQSHRSERGETFSGGESQRNMQGKNETEQKNNMYSPKSSTPRVPLSPFLSLISDETDHVKKASQKPSAALSSTSKLSRAGSLKSLISKFSGPDNVSDPGSPQSPSCGSPKSDVPKYKLHLTKQNSTGKDLSSVPSVTVTPPLRKTSQTWAESTPKSHHSNQDQVDLVKRGDLSSLNGSEATKKTKQTGLNGAELTIKGNQTSLLWTESTQTSKQTSAHWSESNKKGELTIQTGTELPKKVDQNSLFHADSSKRASATSRFWTEPTQTTKQTSLNWAEPNIKGDLTSLIGTKLTQKTEQTVVNWAESTKTGNQTSLIDVNSPKKGDQSSLFWAEPIQTTTHTSLNWSESTKKGDPTSLIGTELTQKTNQTKLNWAESTKKVDQNSLIDADSPKKSDQTSRFWTEPSQTTKQTSLNWAESNKKGDLTSLIDLDSPKKGDQSSLFWAEPTQTTTHTSLNWSESNKKGDPTSLTGTELTQKTNQTRLNWAESTKKGNQNSLIDADSPKKASATSRFWTEPTQTTKQTSLNCAESTKQGDLISLTGTELTQKNIQTSQNLVESAKEGDQTSLFRTEPNQISNQTTHNWAESTKTESQSSQTWAESFKNADLASLMEPESSEKTNKTSQAGAEMSKKDDKTLSQTKVESTKPGNQTSHTRTESTKTVEQSVEITVTIDGPVAAVAEKTERDGKSKTQITDSERESMADSGMGSESELDTNKQLESPSEDEPTTPRATSTTQNPKYQLFLNNEMKTNGVSGKDADGPGGGGLVGENGPRPPRWETVRLGTNHYRGSLESLTSRDVDTNSDRISSFDPSRAFISPYSSSMDYNPAHRMSKAGLSPATSEMNLYTFNNRSPSPNPLQTPSMNSGRPRYSAYDSLIKMRTEINNPPMQQNHYSARSATLGTPNRKDFIEELTKELDAFRKRNQFLEAESVAMDKERTQIRFEMRNLLVHNEDLLRNNTQLNKEMKRLREQMIEMDREKQVIAEKFRQMEIEVKEAREVMVEANTQEYAFNFLQQSLQNRLKDAEENLEKETQHSQTVSEKLWLTERQLEELELAKGSKDKKTSELNSTIDRLETELREAQLAATQATTELNLQMKLREDAQMRLEELEDTLVEKEQELQKAQVIVNRLQGEVSGKLIDKERTLEEEIQLRERIQLQCKQAERMVDDLQMELTTTNQTREDLAKQFKVAQEKMIDLESDLEELHDSEQRWASKHKRAIEQTEQLQLKLIQEKDQNDMLEADKAAMERQLRQMRLEVEELQSSRVQEDVISRAESRVKELENTLRIEERNKSVLTNNINKLERKVNELGDQMEEEHRIATEQKDLMTQRMRSLKRQLNEAEEEASRKEGQYRHTQRELAEERETSGRLQRQLLDQHIQTKRMDTMSIRQTLDNLKLDLSVDEEDEDQPPQEGQKSTVTSV